MHHLNPHRHCKLVFDKNLDNALTQLLTANCINLKVPPQNNVIFYATNQYNTQPTIKVGYNALFLHVNLLRYFASSH